MNEVAFDSLVGMVPAWGANLELNRFDAVLREEEKHLHFVKPNFIRVGDAVGRNELGQPRILLISAPAAVGKSSLAKKLCRDTGNPYWDLSRFNVGSNFFTGTIAKLYGAENFGIFVDAISTGSGCLVVDAADEAVVRAGMDNFEESLGDLSDLIGVGSSLSAVILGRPDTISDTAEYLAKIGLKTETLDVEFFSERQTRDFVESKLAGLGRPVARAELQDFLGDFFREVQRALGAEGEWRQSASFLGYAPVLDALVAFYEEGGNGKRLLERLKRAQSTAHVWDLLVEVVRTVCERETDKFATSFGGEDPRKRRFASIAYSTSIQVAKLAAEDPLLVSFPLSEDGETEWLEEIEDQVNRQFKVHPFLIRGVDDNANPLENFANVAFRDFVIASVILDGVQDEAMRISALTMSSSYNPSPLLCRFMYSTELQKGSVIPISAFGALVDSNSTASSIDGSELILEPLAADDESLFVSAGFEEVLEGTLLDNGSMQGALLWGVRSDESIELLREAANITINVPGRKILAGGGFSDFVMGPRVRIRAETVEFGASEIRVRGDAESGVDVWAEAIQGRVRKIVTPVSGSLRITTRHSFHPWQMYAVSPSDEGWADTEIYAAGMEFRRLGNWFTRKSMNRGGLRYPASAMDTIVSKGRAPKEFLDYCREIGVLVVEGHEYVLALDFPAPAFLQNEVSNPSYREFLIGYLDWTRNRS